MNSNTKKVKELYESSTGVYLATTGYYIHGCAPPENFNLPLYILSKLNVFDGNSVLDCGCGMGKMLIEMAKLRPKINFFGITISEEQYKICNQLKNEENVLNVEFILGDFHQLSFYFNEASFDAIYFNESLFHSNNYKQVLSEVKKILKTQGIFYSKDFYINYWIDKYIPFTSGYKLIKYIKENYFYHPVLHNEMIKAMNELGFNIISFNKPNYIPNFQKVIDFEKAYGLKTYQLIQKTNAIHWRELIASKKSI
ncbi:MAG: class I SAM-dependent methyltransferase [Flavobacteriales bacterium]|nr:class I SAM-dependent methyltransferase [Flavobacteriales bacterium]